MIKCFAVDNSVQVLPQGGLQPCCKFRTPVSNVNQFNSYFGSHEITKLRESHDVGDWTDNCVRCKQDEQAGNQSRREMYDRIGLTAGDFFLDISMSNHCNLACRMCGPEYSTQWIQDSKALVEAGLSNAKNTEIHSLTTTQIDKIAALLETKEGRVVIEVKGGEPLLMPISHYFFEALANCHNSDKFEIWVTSNATRIPIWWHEVTAKFATIRFHVSIDGTGETYKYIRGGHSYEAVKMNIEKIAADNVTILFNVVVQNLNIENIADLYDDLIVYVQSPDDINLLVLRSPEYYQINIYPDNSKASLIEMMQSRKIANHNTFDAIVSLFEQPCDSHLWDKFLKITKFLDDRRKQDVCSVIKAITQE